jgi:hypothetical protein
MRPEEVRTETAMNEKQPLESLQLVFLAGEPHPLLLRRLVYDLDDEFEGLADPNPLHTKDKPSAQAATAADEQPQQPEHWSSRYGKPWKGGTA